jgi:chorismate mutase
VNNIKLNYYRYKIDKVDDKIYYLLNNRFEYAKKLSKYKTNVIDLDRQNHILNRLYNKKLLDNKFVKDVWTIVFKKSCKIQKEDIKYVKTKFNNSSDSFNSVFMCLDNCF